MLKEQNDRLRAAEEELNELKRQRDYWTIHLEKIFDRLSGFLRRFENFSAFGDEFFDWADFPDFSAQFDEIRKSIEIRVKEAKKIYGSQAEKYVNSISDRLQKFWAESAGTGEKFEKLTKKFGEWKKNFFETFDDFLEKNKKMPENEEKNSKEEENFVKEEEIAPDFEVFIIAKEFFFSADPKFLRKNLQILENFF